MLGKDFTSPHVYRGNLGKLRNKSQGSQVMDINEPHNITAQIVPFTAFPSKTNRDLTYSRSQSIMIPFSKNSPTWANYMFSVLHRTLKSTYMARLSWHFSIITGMFEKAHFAISSARLGSFLSNASESCAINERGGEKLFDLLLLSLNLNHFLTYDFNCFFLTTFQGFKDWNELKSVHTWPNLGPAPLHRYKVWDTASVLL